MADSNGIAALLRVLDDSPGLGSGLRPGPSVQRSGAFAAAAGIAKPANAGATSAAATPARPMRAAASLSTATARPKTLIADGMAYNAGAPRGTYLDLVI